MFRSDFQTEQDARDMMDLADEERGIPADVAKILQRTDGELARLHARLAEEFRFPEFTEDETFVAVPMPGTSAANIDDRFPE